MFYIQSRKSMYSVSKLISRQSKEVYQTTKCLTSNMSAQDKLDELSRKIMDSTLVTPAKQQEKNRKQRESKIKPVRLKQDVIIQCKREELNHYRNQTYDKFGVIPLASKGWNHYKSKADHFIINIHPEGYQSMSRINLGTFEDTGLNRAVIKILTDHGFTQPTEIQTLGIPQLLSGENSILVAETGCGKTLSFLAPLVEQILLWKSEPYYQENMDSPLALIITPGRELVFQIGEVAEWFKELGITYKVISGGDMKRKIYSDPEQVDIVIASLGALSKLTTVGKISTRRVRHIIMDEADTLLDDSFNEKMVYYLSRMQVQKMASKNATTNIVQLTLVGATMPRSLDEILGDVVDVDSMHKIMTNRVHQLMPHVPQKFIRIGASQKPAELLKIARKDAKYKLPLIIFSNKTETCDWISLFLNENGIECVNLNKATLVEIRKQQLLKFQTGIVDVMSCTDVASRGLDTVRAKHILNYDFPYYISDYIHRCGRTGRHSPHGLMKGIVTNLISNNPREISLVQTIEKSVRTMEKELPNINANIRRIIHHRYVKKYGQKADRDEERKVSQSSNLREDDKLEDDANDR